MPRTPNATHAPDPAVATSAYDPRHSPDAGPEAWVEIPAQPFTLAEQKLRDPECAVGSASDHAGVLDEVIRSSVNKRY
jgi:hypothetical protein